MEMMLTEVQEMFLERVWSLQEQGKNLEESEIQNCQEVVDYFLAKKYLIRENKNIRLTSQGDLHSKDLIRRRRLTELLLFNILKLDIHAAQRNACKIEHIINGEVSESICALLGHPSHCPHGKPIPPGQCCSNHNGMVKPLLKSLPDFEIGEKGKVALVALNNSNLVNRLTSLGLYPGAIVVMRQCKPVCVIRVGETDIALEPEIAMRIYCRF